MPVHAERVKPRSSLTHPVTEAAISIASDLMPKTENKILFTTTTKANTTEVTQNIDLKLSELNSLGIYTW